jgi:hypothetical protein
VIAPPPAASPALAAPRARISLTGLPRAAAFAGRHRAYLDDFIECPGWPGCPEAGQPGARAISAEAVLDTARTLGLRRRRAMSATG